MNWSKPGSVVTTRLNESICEYPKIDDRQVGLPYRFGFVACGGVPGTGDLFHRAIGRYELETKLLTTFHFGGASAISEAIFVPKRPEAGEGHGHLLLTVFDERRNASYLAFMDAMHIEAGPIAKAHLDHRVPLGFHGVWRASAIP